MQRKELMTLAIRKDIGRLCNIADVVCDAIDVIIMNVVIDMFRFFLFEHTCRDSSSTLLLRFFFCALLNILLRFAVFGS